MLPITALDTLAIPQLLNDAAASAFLRAAAPVRWTPVKQKSAWRHALCAGLATWLGPATIAQGPRAAAWAEALAAVRVETLAWVAKAERKHLAHGYPLVSALLCAEADEAQLRAFLEGPLLRALRDKDRPVRTAALDSLRTAVRFYTATRCRAPNAAPDALWVATGAAIAAIPASFRRAGGSSRSFIADSDFEALASIAVYAVQVDSVLVLEGLLPDLLKDGPTSDASVAALRALKSVVSAAGAVPTQEGQFVQSFGDAGLAQALTRMRRGLAALGVLGTGGALPVQLRSALGSVARAASGMLATTASPAVKKGEQGLQALLDSSACDMACALLDCVPFIMPDEWRNDGALAAVLPSFLVFPDALLRSAGAAALRRVVHAGVGGRNQLSARVAVLEGVVEFALRYVELEALNSSTGTSSSAIPLAASDATEFVRTLISDWHAATALDASDDTELGGWPRQECSLSRIEGAAIAIAAFSSGASTKTRVDALAVLTELATLSRSDGHRDAVLADLIPDFCSGPVGTEESSNGASADNQQWLTAFCVGLGYAAAPAPAALLAARAHAIRRLNATLALITQTRDDERGAAVDAWRAAACVAVASLSVPESADQAAERMLLVKAVSAPLRAALFDMFSAVECALSCASPGAASALTAEVSLLVMDAARAPERQAAELRHAAALIVRGLAATSALKTASIEPLLEFVQDSLAVLFPRMATTASNAASDTTVPPHAVGLSSDVLIRRLALVDAAIATPALVWPALVRAQLFDACAAWSTAYSSPEAADASVTKLGSAPGNGVVPMPRTVDELRCAAADACASLAAASMADSAFPASTVLQWAQLALQSPCSFSAACRALCATAKSEPASLASLLDAAYLDAPIGAVYFSNLASGIVTHRTRVGNDVTVPSIASLLAVTILYSADARTQVRSDACMLLQALAGLPGIGATIAGVLTSQAVLPDDSCVALSSTCSLVGARLARDAPLLCEQTCSELLHRALQVLQPAERRTSHVAIWRALKMLPVWLENASLPRTEAGGAAPRLLLALFAVSSLGASEVDGSADCVDALWMALCARPANATVVTDFLLQQCKLCLAPSTSQDLGCVERCLLAAAAAQPHVVANDLLAAHEAPGAEPCAREDADAALVLLASLSATPLQGVRSELRAATASLLHAAVVVLCRSVYEDSGTSAGPSTTGSVLSSVGILEARAQKLVDNLISLARSSNDFDGMARSKALLDGEATLFLDSVFDALSMRYGDNKSAATMRGTVLRNTCASKALTLLADTPSHVEALSAVAVLRVLRRPLCQSSTAVLCECIVACLSPGRASRMPYAAGLFASQCLAVLAAAAEATPPPKLLLHPCVFWAAAAALRSPSALLAPHACAALLAFLRALAPSHPDAPPGVAEEVLLLAAPGVAGLPGAAASRGASFPGLARVALRAACTCSTELAPLLLAHLVLLPRGGAADALYGDADGRLWLGLGGAMPWILSEDDVKPGDTLSRREAAAWLADGARCRRGCAALVAVLQAIAAGTCTGLDACETLRAPLSLVLAPSSAALMAASLLEVLRAGMPGLVPPTLALLRAVFEAPSGVRPMPDLTPLTVAAAGSHGPAARAALESALSALTRSGSATQTTNVAGPSFSVMWPEGDDEAAASLLGDALAGAGAKRRDAPSFLFQ